jgi:hypothetical protein
LAEAQIQQQIRLAQEEQDKLVAAMKGQEDHTEKRKKGISGRLTKSRRAPKVLMLLNEDDVDFVDEESSIYVVEESHTQAAHHKQTQELGIFIYIFIYIFYFIYLFFLFLFIFFSLVLLFFNNIKLLIV